MVFRPRLWASVFTVLALAILLSLGVWQLERRAWKHDLVARIEANLKAEPQDLVGVLTASGVAADYARVEADGTIAPDKAVHLFAPAGQGAADRLVGLATHDDRLAPGQLAEVLQVAG